MNEKMMDVLNAVKAQLVSTPDKPIKDTPVLIREPGFAPPPGATYPLIVLVPETEEPYALQFGGEGDMAYPVRVLLYLKGGKSADLALLGQAREFRKAIRLRLAAPRLPGVDSVYHSEYDTGVATDLQAVGDDVRLSQQVFRYISDEPLFTS